MLFYAVCISTGGIFAVGFKAYVIAVKAKIIGYAHKHTYILNVPIACALINILCPCPFGSAVYLIQIFMGVKHTELQAVGVCIEIAVLIFRTHCRNGLLRVAKHCFFHIKCKSSVAPYPEGEIIVAGVVAVEVARLDSNGGIEQVVGIRIAFHILRTALYVIFKAASVITADICKGELKFNLHIAVGIFFNGCRFVTEYNLLYVYMSVPAAPHCFLTDSGF